MYSVILYSLFILFWIAIIYDFIQRPKDRDEDFWSEFSLLRKTARGFWIGWILVVLLYTLVVSLN
jgi:hypothetical protein|tara:strand:+ start:4075 stop:4269 length:195 start_codon:yes stop_codon:yes gene_type:complete